MNRKERMLAGFPYKDWLYKLAEDKMENKLKLYEYNLLCPDEIEEFNKLIKAILGKTGEKICIEQPFYCDYGKNIEVGENFFANYDCKIMDRAKVKIGNNVMFEANVSIYTNGYVINSKFRDSNYKFGNEVVIGDNVWIGGNVVINPGVKIGNNVIIDSGSVVSMDIPDNVIATGNPCKVLLEITQDEVIDYFKSLTIDLN
ncbi:sugar O-acetyltransferase [Clostridium intestinale]|uniref:sugar O-acetyltransferase n=1 Tax=Clostridium intestinale TaxID=36845 RepID=UPI0028EBCFFD|nr:sugar O-acetyltransferase [Clostridium intestinale]